MPTPPRPRLLTRRDGLMAVMALGPLALVSACSGSDEAASATGSAAASAAAPASIAEDVAAQESALIARYDAAITALAAADPAVLATLGEIRDQHAAHRDALGGGPDRAKPPSLPPTLAGVLGELGAAERDAALACVRACVAAEDPALARVLALIGASESAHVPALRDLRP